MTEAGMKKVERQNIFSPLPVLTGYPQATWQIVQPEIQNRQNEGRQHIIPVWPLRPKVVGMTSTGDDSACIWIPANKKTWNLASPH